MDDEVFVRELNKQLEYWQKLLYLQDWTVEIRVSRPWEMSDPQALAECEWYLQRKDAIIRVLPPSDLSCVESHFLSGEAQDYDISIVHELLHLHFAPFHAKDDETAHEQAINALSRAYVKLYRVSPAESLTPAPHAQGYL